MTTETVTQKALAARLGVTDRRVRQLIERNILPAANHAGRYEFDECERRYHLYSTGAPFEWNTFIDELEADGRRLTSLRAAAHSPKAKLAEIGVYGRATLAWFSRLKFAQACRIKSETELALISRLVAYDEAASFDDVLQAVDAMSARQAPKGKTPVPARELLGMKP